MGLRYSVTGQLSDPARRPVTESARDCNVNFPFQSGGNPALQSEKSTQWGVGALWSPVPSLSIGVDYFDVAVDNLIFALNASTIFQLCPDGENGQTCQFVERGPVEPAHPTLPGPVRLINQSLFNIGTVRVTGIDVNALYRFPKLDWGQFKLSLQGTYITKYQQQQINGSYLDQVNHELIVPFVGAIPYWRHYLTLDWTYGPWSATMTQNFQAGTYDVNPNPGRNATAHHRRLQHMEFVIVLLRFCQLAILGRGQEHRRSRSAVHQPDRYLEQRRTSGIRPDVYRSARPRLLGKRQVRVPLGRPTSAWLNSGCRELRLITRRLQSPFGCIDRWLRTGSPRKTRPATLGARALLD